MASQKEFRIGVEAFQRSQFGQAVEHFDKAISLGFRSVRVYDSRSAALDKLGKIKEALQDAKKCISLDPKAIQGYIRAARLFLRIAKYPNALTMISTALTQLNPGDDRRRSSILALQTEILLCQEEAQRLAKQTICHISKLPIEILVEIFRLSVLDGASGTRHLKLAATCSHWRTVIFRDPQFWSILVLPRYKSLKKLVLWKEHSRGRIRELHLGEHLGDDGVNLAMDQLGSCCLHTLSRLKIWICHMRLVGARRGVLFSPSFLEDVEIVGTGVLVGRDEMPATILSFDEQDVTESTLKRLALHNFSTGVQSLLSNDFPNLRELVFTGMAVPDAALLIRYLQSYSKLKELCLQIRIPPSMPSLSSMPFTSEKLDLPELQVLHVSGRYPMTWIFNQCMVPNIVSLTLCAIGERLDHCFQCLKPNNTFSHIRELHLQKCFFEPEPMLSYLAEMKQLTTLDLSGSSSPLAPIIDAIASSDSMCSLLRDLDVSSATMPVIEPCVRLVRARNNPSAARDAIQACAVSLQSLNMDYCPISEPELITWLRSRVPKFTAAVWIEKRRR